MVPPSVGRAVPFLFVAVSCLLSGSASAQGDVESFYRGRTIDLNIGSPPGASYDLYGRVAARYMAKYIPGEPTIVIRHMPGAGGLKMTNWLYNAAPRDGTALAVALHATAVEQALESEGIQYDASKFSWIGRFSPVIEVSYTWLTSPTRTLADSQSRETIMGGSSPTAPSIWYLKVLNVFAGTKFKIIPGYQGANDSHVAMERGELEGTTKAWPTMKVQNADLIRDKKINFLVQFGLEKAPELPDVPLMSELGRDDDERTALRFYALGNAIGRALVGTPEIPRHRLEALRVAFNAMISDPELQLEAKKLNIDVSPPLDGPGLEKIVAETLATKRDVLTKAAKARRD